MNNAQLQPCPLCETSLDLQGPIYTVPKDPLNAVYICRQCGLVYKPVLNFNETFNSDSGVYSVSSWSVGNEVHRQRMQSIANLVFQRFQFNQETSILDIGAGIGLLYQALTSIKPIGNYVALEPVTSVAAHLIKVYPEIFVLNSSIDRASIPDGQFDLIFVLGVDYLFHDIEIAFKKIKRMLKPGGQVVVQRNVFIDQTAYVGQSIESLEDMFGSNLIMRNWFHSDQYSDFLKKHFTIQETVHEEFESHCASGCRCKMFMLTYFCGPSDLDSGSAKVPVKSYFDTNLAILSRLQRNSSAARETSESLTKKAFRKAARLFLRLVNVVKQKLTGGGPSA